MPRGARPGERRGGRGSGTPNKRTREIEAYARSIVQDPQVQELLRTQAKNGILPVPLMQMFFYYAFGKPYERVQVEGKDGGDILLGAGEGLAVLLRPPGSPGHASD